MMAAPHHAPWRRAQQAAWLRCWLIEGAGWLFAAFCIGLSLGILAGALR